MGRNTAQCSIVYAYTLSPLAKAKYISQHVLYIYDSLLVLLDLEYKAGLSTKVTKLNISNKCFAGSLRALNPIN